MAESRTVSKRSISLREAIALTCETTITVQGMQKNLTTTVNRAVPEVHNCQWSIVRC